MRRILPLLSFLVVWNCPQLTAQNLEPLLSSALNFPVVRTIALRQLKDRTFEIRSRLVYNDVYRKRVDNVLALTMDGAVEEVEVFLPHRKGRFSLGINLVYRGTQSWFQNRKDTTALYGRSHSIGDQLGIQLAVTDGVGLLGVGFEVRSVRYEMPVLVKEFPTSEDRLMHSFFLDWLEPAFGRKLDINGRNESFKPLVYASLPLLRNRRLSLFFSHSSSSVPPALHYTNSSNKPELTGDRRIALGLQSGEDLLSLGLANSENGASLLATLFISRFTFDLDNNPPETHPIRLDFDSLGQGEGGRRGVSVTYARETDDFDWRIGLGTCSYLCELDINTPVLGYYGGLFPISHGLTGKITGSSISQRVAAGFSSSLLSARSYLNVGYTHGFFDLDVDLEALLGFNLVSTPVHHPLQYHLHLLQLKWLLERRLGPVTGSYSFTQFLPYLQRVDDSPIRLRRERPDVTIESRGGGIHQLVISFQW